MAEETTKIKGLLLSCSPTARICNTFRDIYYKTQDRDKIETKPNGAGFLSTAQ